MIKRGSVLFKIAWVSLAITGVAIFIFGLAAFAIQRIINTRYAVFSRVAGGVVLIGLGVWMLAR